jgi:hypothetical protein
MRLIYYFRFEFIVSLGVISILVISLNECQPPPPLAAIFLRFTSNITLNHHVKIFCFVATLYRDYQRVLNNIRYK